MKDFVWDVMVIGGGPAGMMAAGRAAELGAKVILLEKNDSLGKKLLITGGGRCNITNAEFDNRKLLEKFKDDGKFLFSAFSQWSVKETLDFFHNRNMETKTEPGQRVFPVSNRSQSVWNVMVEYIKKNNVTVLSNSPVTDLIMSDDKKNITGIKIKNKNIYACSVIVATGGTSHPETGSTGDAYKWLKYIGHKIIETAPSLVPLAAKDKWIKKLAGVSLNDIKLTIFLNGVKQNFRKKSSAKIGKILFTHVGISGPTILNMSKDVSDILSFGDVVVSLDLLPNLDQEKLNLKLLEIFKENDKKKFKNCLSSLIPSAIIPVITDLSGIDPEMQCNSVTREGRMKLVNLLKNIPIHIDKLLGLDMAVISSGGVPLNEVDFKTMRSRIFPNLYLIGDILNVDRPTGGYGLQLCWTTGFVAGTSAANK
ncbi:MAG: NAD(P)/FAD-dependent oxidoreductase [Minisyncoccia bacterium]